jgi:hypothetical protein
MRIPENPYNLIAILHGNDKRIIIREFTGDLVSVKEGGTLIDGAIVKKIGDSVVTLVKGNQTKELKILDYKALAVSKPSVAPVAAKPGGTPGVASGANKPSQSIPVPMHVPRGSQQGGQRSPGEGGASGQQGKR